jgi:hypothetical protein
LAAVLVACNGGTTAGPVPTPTVQASAVTARPGGSSPVASSPSNPFFTGALSFAIQAAEGKTGLQYVASGCGAGQTCLSNAIETDGENATYFQLTATGYSAGTMCFVYVYRDPTQGWQAFAILCGSQPGFSPVYGATVPVRVSGGCANVRQGPGLTSPIVGCLPNGTMVKINATPSYADAKMWWGVASSSVAGMMSQEFLVG